ncbi:MAG: methionine gamma-lyase family protein [Bacillota bacterium]|nr:methionine gamma-lyase family protein [Bacillota bacterium]
MRGQLWEQFQLPSGLLGLVRRAEEKVQVLWEEIRRRRAFNQGKVLRAFLSVGVEEHHLVGTTGYGYGDAGRQALGEVFARALGAERALVSPQIASGTHAIAACLFGVLRPGDHLLFATGQPYDTLRGVIGCWGETPGSLRELGVSYSQVPLLPDGRVDVAGVLAALEPRTRVVAFQRSRGYALRPSLTLEQLRPAIEAVKGARPDVVVFVDNCYGEFVEEQEPTELGADLMAGSLIKNPGGGLAPGGGYVAGRSDLVERVAARLTAPGLGDRVGPTYDFLRPLFQGFFLAPHFVGEALLSAVFIAALAEEMGLEADPAWDAPRGDIVQAIILRDPRALQAFCCGLQSGAAVGSRLRPEPSPMPGYSDPVLMVGGGFVQGASLEFSADAPLRPPYAVFLQGGLVLEQAQLAVLFGFKRLQEEGFLDEGFLRRIS